MQKFICKIKRNIIPPIMMEHLVHLRVCDLSPPRPPRPLLAGAQQDSLSLSNAPSEVTCSHASSFDTPSFAGCLLQSVREAGGSARNFSLQLESHAQCPKTVKTNCTARLLYVLNVLKQGCPSRQQCSQHRNHAPAVL